MRVNMYGKKQDKSGLTLDAVVGLVLLLPVVLWSGFVASVLWGWFVVPTLGAPAIGAVAAAGLILLLGFMHPQPTKDDDENKYPVTFMMVKRAFSALIVLGLGALFNLFM